MAYFKYLSILLFVSCPFLVTHSTFIQHPRDAHLARPLAKAEELVRKLSPAVDRATLSHQTCRSDFATYHRITALNVCTSLNFHQENMAVQDVQSVTHRKCDVVSNTGDGQIIYHLGKLTKATHTGPSTFVRQTFHLLGPEPSASEAHPTAKQGSDLGSGKHVPPALCCEHFWQGLGSRPARVASP